MNKLIDVIKDWLNASNYNGASDDTEAAILTSMFRHILLLVIIICGITLVIWQVIKILLI